MMENEEYREVCGTIKRIRVIFAVCLCAMVVIPLILYCATLKSSPAEADAQTLYLMGVFSVVTTMLVVPFCMKFMSFPFVRERLDTGNTQETLRRYVCHSAVRLVVPAAFIVTYLAFYILIVPDNSLLFCALVLALVYVFHLPTRERLEHETGIWN